MIEEVIINIATALLILIGFVGIFLPVLPSTPIIFAGTLVYAINDKFENVGWKTYTFLAILMIIGLVLDYVAGVYGAKKFGSTKWGILGSFIGGIVGVIVLNLIGLILGAIIGAVAFELLAGQSLKKSIKAGGGVLLGFLGGVILKTIIALIMIGIFLWQIL